MIRRAQPTSAALDSVDTIQRDTVEDLDSLSAEPDHARLLERLEDPAHDFAACPQLVGEHLMGRDVGLRLEKQARSQPLVDSAESHVVNESHQVRHPLGQCVEHEDSEGRGLQDHLQEQASGDAEQRERRVGRSGSRKGRLAEQRYDRDDAAFPGIEKVQEELVAIGTGLRYPDSPFKKQRVVVAGTAVTEKP
jgi:hypothetical protein